MVLEPKMGSGIGANLLKLILKRRTCGKMFAHGIDEDEVGCGEYHALATSGRRYSV